MISIATAQTEDALAGGTPQAAALTEGFSAAFGVEAGVMLTAAVLALAVLRPAAGRRREAVPETMQA